MSFRLVHASDLEAKPGAHPAASSFDKGVGEALGVQAFGLYQVELPPRAETVRHNHAQDRAEDAYAVICGDGIVVVDHDEVALGPGHFIAVTPDSERHVRAGDDGLVFIAVCASATPSGA